MKVRYICEMNSNMADCNFSKNSFETLLKTLSPYLEYGGLQIAQKVFSFESGRFQYTYRYSTNVLYGSCPNIFAVSELVTLKLILLTHTHYIFVSFHYIFVILRFFTCYKIITIMNFNLISKIVFVLRICA